MSQSYSADTFKTTPLKVGYLKVSAKPMSFFLVYTDLDFTVELALPADAHRRMRGQIQRLQEEGDLGAFKARLAAELVKVFPEQIDWDLKPPTPAQWALAKSLSVQFGSQIPLEAQESRFGMHRFIAEHLSLTRCGAKVPGDPS